MSDSIETPSGDNETPEVKQDTFSREYVQELRDEAAKYRNEKKDAVELAKTETRAEVLKEYEPQLAEKVEEIATLTTDLTEARNENLKLRAVLGSEGVAAGDVLELAELVSGNDEESISESVSRVLKIYGKQETKSPAYDPTQGKGAPPALNSPKLLQALKNAVRA